MTAAILTGLSVLAYAAAAFCFGVTGYTLGDKPQLSGTMTIATVIFFNIGVILQLTVLSI
ncbi:hypothetical protein AN189_17965 [Loktanella sp. 3ANDIMAR09]|uniref:hypothetical protein n=1 Tax=Loktanella sp. 3ANDIMAR09 TaxID=1225657 RepID=UPI0006FE9EC3|nr:hypothetical protein [Loktanella sp. 3ANDIMAR09]KQI66944.1 hypothetical protein AN189_17965 [Loktanella sp. 3ANDIMAR09]